MTDIDSSANLDLETPHLLYIASLEPWTWPHQRYSVLVLVQHARLPQARAGSDPGRSDLDPAVMYSYENDMDRYARESFYCLQKSELNQRIGTIWTDVVSAGTPRATCTRTRTRTSNALFCGLQLSTFKLQRSLAPCPALPVRNCRLLKPRIIVSIKSIFDHNAPSTPPNPYCKNHCQFIAELAC